MRDPALLHFLHWLTGLAIGATVLALISSTLFVISRFREIAERDRKRQAVHEQLLQRLAVVPDRAMRADLVELLEELLDDPLLWLETPNLGFGDRPQTLIDAGRADLVLDRLRAIVSGAFS